MWLNLNKQFEKIDTNHTGYICSDNLAQAMKNCNFYDSLEEIEKIINEVDYKGNKQINYSEFIAATIHTKKKLSDSKLREIFNEFDTDCSGFITKENLSEAFSKLGRDITDIEIDEIMQRHVLTYDEEISFDEFKIMMLGPEELMEILSDSSLDSY